MGPRPECSESIARGSPARSKLFSLLLGVLVLTLIGLAACRSDDIAADFEFTLYQGEEVLGGTELSLAELRGTPVVLNFWAGLCPPCRFEMPDLQAFHEEFGDRVTLLGLDVGPFVGLGSRGSAFELLTELDITYPAGYPPDDTAVRSYKVLNMPSTYFITAEGKIFHRWVGNLNKDILVRITSQMLGLDEPVRQE